MQLKEPLCANFLSNLRVLEETEGCSTCSGEVKLLIGLMAKHSATRTVTIKKSRANGKYDMMRAGAGTKC